MKKYLFIWMLICITCCISCDKSQEPRINKIQVQRFDKPERAVLATMGASLMYSGNGWVEQACERQNIRCLNKAKSSKTTTYFAQQLWLNIYASERELEEIDILLIQFANCGDVCGDSSSLLPTADDYTMKYTRYYNTMFTEYSYAQQMDYILKKWQQICEQNNKPMHVIFVTHWHDGRVTYNKSVRKLAQRWNAEVCELDKNIGFTKDQPLPDGRQPSVLYAKDTEFINGVEFGWHPLREAQGTYIQSVMAGILEEKLKDYLYIHFTE